jgi:hypothetical protein
MIARLREGKHGRIFNFYSFGGKQSLRVLFFQVLHGFTWLPLLKTNLKVSTMLICMDNRAI